MTSRLQLVPPDQDQRIQALDPRRSLLVQAPAGSGKTDLLTRRFLRLLADVDDPTQIVAITFTKAAAAEMRHRIVAELEKAALNEEVSGRDEFSMDALALRALERSRALGWNVIDLSGQLRISTIDSFCRELAVQQPLLSGLGGGLDIAGQPEELYRRAARRTLERLASDDPTPQYVKLRHSIETLLGWRDNNWQNLEDQLVEMLGQRDRWMQGFVLEREQDWEALRNRLERPFAREVSNALARLDFLFDQHPSALDEAHELARFACSQSSGLHQDLAELAEFPRGAFEDPTAIEAARRAYACVANLFLTKDGTFRQTVTKRQGFPSGYGNEKAHILRLADELAAIEGMQSALTRIHDLPSARYTDEEWSIVRGCFTLLRQAAGELQVVFAESGVVDYVEVAQLAERVLEGSDGAPTDVGFAIADGIHHLLVDEFQDTSRRQHKLIAGIVSAWPDIEQRTLFVVGDPMQSIYFFRDADAELFPRVRHAGLELNGAAALPLEFVPLASNFRTAPQLVERMNDLFTKVFTPSDGSQVRFAPALPVRTSMLATGSRFSMNFAFMPQSIRRRGSDIATDRAREVAIEARNRALDAQSRKIVSLIVSHADRMERVRHEGGKYRIAVLGRTRAALLPVAQALRAAAIPFRAVDLEPLAERQEVLDALALARAFMNIEDRVAWLGVLRAPWCGLTLSDLHALMPDEDAASLRKPIPALLEERVHQLSSEGQRSVGRLMSVFVDAPSLRHPSPGASFGTWLSEVWARLGGHACADAVSLVNLKLLWKCLDSLPGGEPDFLGPALQTALKTLTAQPDPAANSDYGVQLMTIHKSKGLEFEMVIVPELQAGRGPASRRMLTWLERGLATPDESGEITEFLIAPLQARGGERGKAKEWVDRAYRERETQEMRRILYVAATRAREELHLFARPEYKIGADGEPTLCRPCESLLLTAWPALEEDARAQFDRWLRKRANRNVVSLAAAGESNVIQMSLPFFAPIPAPTLIRRLPADYQVPLARRQDGASQRDRIVGDGATSLYQRHEGGAASRALGSAVHAFFEELARSATQMNADQTRAALEMASPRVAAQIRAAGIAPQQANRIVEQALDITQRASRDPVAAWILAPHRDASSEARWSGFIDGVVRNVQVDRVFRGGREPLAKEENVWWIIDYKTAHSAGTDAHSQLRELRAVFAPQLEVYARMLRNLHGADALIRAGLYYPRMLRLDWWEI